jgi:hypothetical protein
MPEEGKLEQRSLATNCSRTGKHPAVYKATIREKQNIN